MEDQGWCIIDPGNKDNDKKIKELRRPDNQASRTVFEKFLEDQTQFGLAFAGTWLQIKRQLYYSNGSQTETTSNKKMQK